MTKRILSAILLAGMISSSAFASNARIETMFSGDAAGTTLNKGSYYYDDMYNVFYNPAYVNDFKNWVIYEKGAANSAQGGFVSSMGMVNVGLYLNRQGSLSNTFATNAKMHPIDVIVGGDMGVKWGFGLTYAGYKKGEDNALTDGGGTAITGPSKGQAIVLRGGVSVMDLEPFVEFKLKDKAETSSSGASKKVEEANKGFAIGAKYHFGEWAPYAVYRTSNKEKTMSLYTATADNGTTEDKDTTILVGIGRNSKLGDSARLMYAVSAAKTSGETKIGVITADKQKRTIVPLNMAVEADAVSWLTLRAGMQYNVFNHLKGGAAISGGSDSGANNVLARAGGTFHVGKVDADFTFGNNTAAAGNATTVDSANVGFDSGTFSTVSVSYKW